MRNDIMLDIETLGTERGATIFQIAAASFDITTGEINKTINLQGDIGSYESLSVDGDTLKWWLGTDAELLTKLLHEGTLSEDELVIRLYKFLTMDGEMRNTYLWGNGIMFDNVKIQDLFGKHGVTYPIKYRNDRDLRTLVELATHKLGIDEKELKASVADESERKHDALDDVKFQIRLASKCHSVLIG